MRSRFYRVLYFSNATPSGATCNLRFPGQYFDAESGLNYNYMRDYNPSLGRYSEADPIGLMSGINPYTYVGNHPTKFFDSFGLMADDPPDFNKLVDPTKFPKLPVVPIEPLTPPDPGKIPLQKPRSQCPLPPDQNGEKQFGNVFPWPPIPTLPPKPNTPGRPKPLPPFPGGPRISSESDQLVESPAYF